MLDELITGIVYVQFDDVHGTDPAIWMPSDLSEQIRMLVGIKSISLLTGEGDFVPEKILIVPFPSQNQKALIKFLQWEDESRRGGAAKSVLAILFEEINDVIFYKYRSHLDSAFEETAHKIIKLEISKGKYDDIKEVINDLRVNILKILDEFRIKEEFNAKTKAFPETSLKGEILKDYTFKIIVCGDPGVGKTSTILRFTDSAFIKSYLPTIGVNLSEKFLRVEDARVTLTLWDIAGQQKFNRMRKYFYQGVDGLLLMFDLTRPESFDSIEKWYNDIKKNIETECIEAGFIIGNKQDLVDDRKVVEDIAISLTKKLNLNYFETSALTGYNINNVFFKIAQNIIKTI